MSREERLEKKAYALAEKQIAQMQGNGLFSTPYHDYLFNMFVERYINQGTQ